MDLITSIKKNFESKSDQELITIYKEYDLNHYSKQTYEIIRSILEERDLKIPAITFTYTCSDCGVEMLKGESVCSLCGYDHIKNKSGQGNIKFSFPEVKHSYSSSGKMVLQSIPLMLVGGSISGALGGALVAFLQKTTGMWAVIFSFLAASLITFIISAIGLATKNRNQYVAGIIGLFSGIIAWIFSSSHIFGQQGDNFTIFINFILFILGVSGGCYYAVRENPFCEKCKEFMSYKIKRGIPIKHEKTIMKYFQAHNYYNDEMEKILSEEYNDEKNHIDVSLYYCNECKDGYISVTTTQSRKKTKEESRLIYSDKISQPEVNNLESSLPKKV